MIAVLILVIGLVASVPAYAASHLDGRWEVTYPCLLAAGACGDRSDEFFLTLWSTKNRLCGTHLATAHLGNRVDEPDQPGPSLTGVLSGDTATATFRSSWGGTGRVALRVTGDELHWHIVKQDGGTAWLPKDATLKRSQRGQPVPQACD